MVSSIEAASPDASPSQSAGRHNERPAADSSTAETIEFGLLASAIYHDLCEARYARLHRILTAANLLLGSGAAVAIGVEFPIWAQCAGIAIAGIGTVQLVWDFTGRARDHGVARRSYCEVLAAFQEGGDVVSARSRMTRLYGDEPPMIEALRRKAHNSAGESLFGDDFERV